jgi:tRNA(Arg) A34 adenosine deaminase TadA
MACADGWRAVTPAAWRKLEPAWRQAFELMWEAYRAGSIPVGAVLADEAGAIVARSRNRIFEDDRPTGELSRSRLAHAEFNVLVGLTSKRTYEGWTLYTTLEPCLFCLGAAYAVRVGRVLYAGADRYGGACGHVAANDDMRAHPVHASGPLDGPLGFLAEALHVAFFLKRRPDGNVIATYRREDPQLVERASKLAATGAAFEEALPGLLAAVAYV